MAAIFADTLMFTGILPLLPEMSASAGLSAWLTGLLLAAYSFSGVLLCLPLGIASDRWHPRPIFIAGVAGMSLSAFLVAAFPTPAGIGLGRLVQGMAGSALWTSGMAIAGTHYGAGRRGEAVARIFAAASLGELVGPALSGYLFEQAGVSLFFVLAGLLGLALAGGLLLLSGRARPRETRSASRPDDQIARGRAKPGWSALPASGALSFAVTIVFAIMLLFNSFILDGALGLGPAEIGLAMVGWNVFMILGTLAGGRWADRVGARVALAWGMLAVGGGLGALWLLPPGWLVLGGLYLASGGIGVTSTVATSNLSAVWERQRPAGSGLGTAFGVTNTVWSLGFMAGNSGGGWLLTITAMDSIFMGMVVILIPIILALAYTPLRRWAARRA
jgi:MFS family permease